VIEVRDLAVVVIALATAGSVGGGEVAPLPTIDCVAVVDGPSLPAGNGRVAFGGCSDLAVAEDTDDRLVLWTITDRGPNGMADVGGESRRTLLEPAFVPTIAALSLVRDGTTAVVDVTHVVPLAAADGRPISGRPNGVGRDEPMLERDGQTPLAASPDGVDTEGLVPCGDGFWACEEYRPSLLRLSRDGRVVERHVPAGATLAGAGGPVIDDLPAAYGSRRDNRGFEALAISADGSRLSALLQSPLDHPGKAAARDSGNVRLLVADAATGSPVAEHIYRLGDPTAKAYAARGAPPDDGKLCAMATLADGGLLVLEQGDGGLARLYRVSLAEATNVLGRDGEPVEGIRDLPGAGIVPANKRLVADLGPLRGRMLRDVYGDRAEPEASLKLEGLAVLRDGRVALINDNDFSVHKPAGEPAAHTCLWILSLPNSHLIAASPRSAPSLPAED
jgi:hypothetical protein